jgi:hypothetical protein
MEQQPVTWHQKPERISSERYFELEEGEEVSFSLESIDTVRHQYDRTVLAALES